MGYFADPEVKGIFARGGWGSARVLPHLDYEVIGANPKVLLGYSDATALLTGVHAKDRPRRDAWPRSREPLLNGTLPPHPDGR